MSLYNVINRTLLQSGQLEDISQVLANFDAIAAVINGNIDNANVSPTAAIDYSKLSVPAGAIAPAKITGFPNDATKYFRGDGTWPSLPTIPLGTSLPASPNDTDEAILVDSLTLPTYAWRFRYVAGISDANKWIFIGGSPAESEVQLNESTTSLTYVNLPTIGPQITVPRAGVYIIEFGAWFAQSGGGTASWMSFAIGGTAAVDADAIFSYLNISSGGNAAQAKAVIKTLAAGTALVAKYRLNAATAGNPFDKRWMKVTPVRVA